MNDPVIKAKQILEAIKALLQSSVLPDKLYQQIVNLCAALDTPCELAIAGRVKAGKSSLINALLGVDLAKTGTTETTATINYFKYGIPKDPLKPVRCVYYNGRETWVSREYLDSLQDNTEEALEKATGIRHLEYYLPDPRLEKITIVDTPGFDAIVGEDGEGHEKVSNQYLLNRLRNRHSQETEDIASSADAVIYLMGQVANLSTQRILGEFKTASGGKSSAMNAIGVMAKCDITDAVMAERKNLAASAAQKLTSELNTIVPVSAGIKRALDQLQTNGMLEKFQIEIRRLPEKHFLRMMKIERAYLQNPAVDDLLSKPERIKLKGKMPWRVFVVLCKELYYKDIKEAKDNLEELSGMAYLSELVNEHFFLRGRILRCSRIMSTVLDILKSIKRAELQELRKSAELAKDFLDFVNTHAAAQSNTAQNLRQHLAKTCINHNDIDELSMKTDNLIRSVENLQLELQQTDNDFRALKLLETDCDNFSEDEISELYSLFGQYTFDAPDIQTIARRQMYWKQEYNWARNMQRKQIAQLAIEKYGLI